MPPYLKFPVASSFSTQNINKCWLFMAQHHLCVKYFIYKWNPDLADQIKKAEYPALRSAVWLEMGGWKAQNSALFGILWLFHSPFLMDFALAFSHASLTSASEENYMAQGLCILLVLQTLYFFLKCMQKAWEIQLFHEADLKDITLICRCEGMQG